MTKWSDTVTRRTTYRAGRYNGLRVGLVIGMISSAVVFVSINVRANTECVGVEECLAVHLDSYEFAYRPEFNLPPRKPE